MEYDLLIRGGRVVDGSGFPSYLADIGYAADIAIFDPQAVKAREPEWADDYPGATRRLIQRSEGMHAVIVNGKAIYQNGKLTGDLPGQVLRGAANRLFGG